jgi:hypothetical protein
LKTLVAPASRISGRQIPVGPIELISNESQTS